MKSLRFAILQFVILLLMLAIAPRGYSQASLAAENIIDDIKVTVKGAVATYTLIRDGRQEDQWYYVPNEPRLVERTYKGQQEPEFMMLRDQFPDPVNKEKLVEDGIVQFSATLAAPAEAVEQMRAALVTRKNLDGKKLRFAALPLKSAEVALYTPVAPDQPANLISGAPQGAGIAPINANQKMVFSIPVTKQGSDVMEAIARSNTGIPIAVTYTYMGLTPPAGVKVTVNWDNTFNHFSSDEKFRATASYFGWFGASYESSKQKIIESLIGNKDIVVKGITSEEFSVADLEKVLQPVLARINTELGEAFKAPPAVEPAKASSPSAGGYFGSVGYSSATKQVKIRKSGTDTFDYSIQSVVERKTVASGFIGIGTYPKDVQDKLITIVPEGPFKSAYLALPPAAGLEQLNVMQADLEVGLKNGTNTGAFQLATWTQASGWTSKGDPRTTLVFGLLGNGVQDPNFKNTEFVTHLTLTTPLQVLKTWKFTPTFTGERAMQAINQPAYEVVEVDASYMTFKQIAQHSNLVAVNVAFNTPTDAVSQAIRPSNVDGVKTPPGPFRWLIPRGEPGTPPAPLMATIKFQMADSTFLDWKFSGKNIRDVFPSPYIYLDDSVLKSDP